MKIEVRKGAPRVGIEYTEQAIVIFKPGVWEFWRERETRLAIHRWGKGWKWDDTNKPCPAHVEQALNRENIYVQR